MPQRALRYWERDRREPGIKRVVNSIKDTIQKEPPRGVQTRLGGVRIRLLSGDNVDRTYSPFSGVLICPTPLSSGVQSQSSLWSLKELPDAMA